MASAARSNLASAASSWGKSRRSEKFGRSGTTPHPAAGNIAGFFTRPAAGKKSSTAAAAFRTFDAERTKLEAERVQELERAEQSMSDGQRAAVAAVLSRKSVFITGALNRVLRTCLPGS